MKNYFILCFVILLAIITTPVAALDFSSFSPANVKENITLRSSQTSVEKSNSVSTRTVKVMSASSGNITTTDELDYLIGCVASEMPAVYNDEALKAQTVAAYTNLIRLRQNPDASLNGADISDSPSKHQGYYDEQTLRKKWGENYDSYHQKIESAVTSVIGQAVTYDGKPITAAYCSMTPGRTESAENIWGGSIPYLISVPSPGDKLAPDCVSTLVLSADEVRGALSKESDVSLGDDPSQWFGESVLTDSQNGVVKSIIIGGKSFTGNAVRSIFSLRSPSFTVTFDASEFTFEVAGYGHCVGMSQYGANYMAQHGSNYKEILEHYYPGTKIEAST